MFRLCSLPKRCLTGSNKHRPATSVTAAQRTQPRSILRATMSSGDENKGVYVLVVTGKLKPGQMDTFVNNFKPLADYVSKNELGALTYKLSLGADDPDRLVIFERYISKDYLENVHWQSDAFKQFGAANQAAGIEWEIKEVVKYYETDIGYNTR